MLNPVGRLPAQVYWRRRLLIGVGLVVVLAGGWFLVGGASGASGDSENAATQDSAQTSSAAASEELPVPGLEQVVPSLVPTDPGVAGGEGSAPAPAPAPAADSGPPPDSVPPTTPDESGPCPNEAIGLTVGSELGQYAAGSKPLLGLAVTNLSPVPCVRELDPALQTWALFAGDGTRLWGSNDCFPEPSAPNAALLQPGQVVAFTIIWSGKTSEPGCGAARQVLGPGSYILRGYLGDLVSPDVPLVLT